MRVAGNEKCGLHMGGFRREREDLDRLVGGRFLGRSATRETQPNQGPNHLGRAVVYGVCDRVVSHRGAVRDAPDSRRLGRCRNRGTKRREPGAGCPECRRRSVLWRSRRSPLATLGSSSQAAVGSDGRGDSRVADLALLPRLSRRVGGAERPWLVEARPSRSLATKATSLGTGRPIPEPTSLLLLIMGAVGVYARRRLLRRPA